MIYTALCRCWFYRSSCKGRCLVRTNNPQGRMSRKVKALATSGVRLDGCVANLFDFVCWLSTLLSGFSVVDLCPVSCPFPFFPSSRMLWVTICLCNGQGLHQLTSRVFNLDLTFRKGVCKEFGMYALTVVAVGLQSWVNLKS